jgi:hypothetical protein
MRNNTWCHIEIPVQNRERAVAFYEKAFGWKFTYVPEMQYTLYSTGDGEIGGGLFTPQPGQPAMMTNYVNVDSIEDSLAAVGAAGGKTVQPRFAVGNVGWIAIAQDTEGNTFGLWKSANPPPAAAPAKNPAAKKKPARKPAKKSGNKRR